ncbi:MAG: aldose 1-epimerase [Bacteroidetes bacterium]|nr:aldose 1-epimerase [Bacteroidota bacterium]
MEIVPARGACLLDIRFRGKSILHAYRNAEELDRLDWMRSALLFPFPNRLKNGKYHWEGKHYQFPLNDPIHDNALHGFGASTCFSVDAIELHSNKAVIALSLDFKGLEYYPFPFKLKVRYTLWSEPDRFELEVEIENRGQTSMPFAFGWHPYFKLDENGCENWQLQLPVSEEILVSETMIPTGKTKTFSEFDSLQKIGDRDFDTCYQIAGQSAVLKLNHGQQFLQIKPLDKQKAFPYYQLFIPPDRMSIALEPMTANINAFQNMDGLWALKAGESRKTGFKLELSSQ